MMLFKKKFVKALVIGSVFTFLGTVNALAGNTGFVTDDQVNVRSSASIDSSILTQLSTGQPVEILASEGDWLKIKQSDGSPAFVKQEFVQLVQADGVVTDDGVNIRNMPSIDGNSFGTVNAGTVFSVNGFVGDFYGIDYNGAKAFIHKDYLLGEFIQSLGELPVTEPAAQQQQQETVYALVTSATGLNLRQQPSQDAPVLATMSSGTALDLIESLPEWHKVAYNGIEGYVSAEFVSIHKGIKPENSKGAQIIEYAKQFLGTPYVYSGTNLRRGVDCSGFTYAVMRDSGIAVNRSSREQFKNGMSISKDALMIGDLVFFDTTHATNQGYISHVGIYMGGGQFIHSSSSRKSYCVTISSLSEDYYVKRYVGARRVIN